MAKKAKQYLKLKDRKLIKVGLDRFKKRSVDFNSIARIELQGRFRGDTVKYETEMYSVKDDNDKDVYDPGEANKLAKQKRRNTRKDKTKLRTDANIRKTFIPFLAQCSKIADLVKEDSVLDFVMRYPVPDKDVPSLRFSVEPQSGGELDHRRCLLLFGLDLRDISGVFEALLDRSLSPATLRNYRNKYDLSYPLWRKCSDLNNQVVRIELLEKYWPSIIETNWPTAVIFYSHVMICNRIFDSGCWHSYPPIKLYEIRVRKGYIRGIFSSCRLKNINDFSEISSQLDDQRMEDLSSFLRIVFGGYFDCYLTFEGIAYVRSLYFPLNSNSISKRPKEKKAEPLTWLNMELRNSWDIPLEIAFGSK